MTRRVRDYRREHLRHKFRSAPHLAPHIRLRGAATPEPSQVCRECHCVLPYHALDCSLWEPSDCNYQEVSGA